MLYPESKMYITCPKCGKSHVEKDSYHQCYLCDCGWSSSENTLDIKSSDINSCFLSNLFPHKFVFESARYNCKLNCLSMESFIQSLKCPDKNIQKKICEEYSGLTAWKLKFCLPDWRKTGFVYINGFNVQRSSKEYTELITEAYDCLYEQNEVFRELAIKASMDKYLIHSIGQDNMSESLLTEHEYISQLERLKERFKNDHK